MRQNAWFYIGGSKLDRIQFLWIRIGLGLKNLSVRLSLLANLSPSTQEITSLMQTERALSCHTRYRLMLTNLVCPISRGGMGFHYGTEIRPAPQTDSESWHWRQDGSDDTKINEWLRNVQLFPSLNPWNIDKGVSDIRICIRFPFESSFWISVSAIRLQTHYPAEYPTAKPNSDHLWPLASRDKHGAGLEPDWNLILAGSGQDRTAFFWECGAM